MDDESSETEPISTRLYRAAFESSSASDDSKQQFPEIPNYVVSARVGAGGFGCVYRAKRVSDGEIVAIKVLQPQSVITDAIRARFLREATLLCQLKHPRIVRFRELGVTGNRFYLVMDFIDAISWSNLSQNLDSTRRQSLVFQIILHCLDALIYLHTQGIVHRDLKPSNILLALNNVKKVKVLLADFGLAKDYLQAGNSGVTSDNEIVGTLGYLAPELLAGVKYYRPASDQYALAATCYDMLCGRPPINPRAHANALMLIRHHHIPRVETFVPEISNELAEWLHRGLHTDPQKRFSSVQHMREILSRIMSSSPRKTSKLKRQQ